MKIEQKTELQFVIVVLAEHVVFIPTKYLPLEHLTLASQALVVHPVFCLRGARILFAPNLFLLHRGVEHRLLQHRVFVVVLQYVFVVYLTCDQTVFSPGQGHVR